MIQDELGRDEISDDDDYDQDDVDEPEYIERNAKRTETVDDYSRDDDEDDDDEEEGTYDEDSSDEEVATIRLHKPSLKEKIGFLLLGAAASALGGMITYVVTHRKDEKDDRMAQFLMYMLYMMQNQGQQQHHHYIQPNYSVESMEQEKGPIPTEKQFLRYVKEHGRQRAINPSANIRDQPFILQPPRIHESWTVKKNLDGDIEDATKTDEYVR